MQGKGGFTTCSVGDQKKYLWHSYFIFLSVFHFLFCFFNNESSVYQILVCFFFCGFHNPVSQPLFLYQSRRFRPPPPPPWRPCLSCLSANKIKGWIMNKRMITIVVVFAVAKRRIRRRKAPKSALQGERESLLSWLPFCCCCCCRVEIWNFGILEMEFWKWKFGNVEMNHALAKGAIAKSPPDCCVVKSVLWFFWQYLFTLPPPTPTHTHIQTHTSTQTCTSTYTDTFTHTQTPCTQTHIHKAPPTYPLSI